MARGVDPLKANLVAADPSRSDQTICLAVSPALKAIGVPSRPRLFEAKQAIGQYERAHRTRILYYITTPRMAEYERVSALIYSVYLRYAAAEDIHVYSIDVVFVYATPYPTLTGTLQHFHTRRTIEMSTAVIGYMPMPAEFPYRALFLHGRPRHKKYDDFWRKHPPMDRTHRAKIFSAFDALAGFDAWIASKETPYCDRRILSEGEREELDKKLATLRQLTFNSKAARRNRPQITVQYFSPCVDENSFAYGTGGTYETVSGICRKVDDISGTVSIDDQSIPIDDIVSITGPLFEVSIDDIP